MSTTADAMTTHTSTAPACEQKQATQRTFLDVAIRSLGSMRLSVVLLGLLALLTWLGTLAQIDDGLWKTQKEYFESWGLIARLELGLWGYPLFPDANGKGFVVSIPLPGAYPVMGLLFVNLLVGGMLRLKWQLRRAGVLIVHIGIALLLLAGFVKMEYSYSGSLALYEPSSPPAGPRVTESSTFVSFHDHELAVLIDKGDTVVERTVPESQLRGAGGGRVTVTGDDLPFRVEVHHWVVNGMALPKGPMVRSPLPVLDDGDGGAGIVLVPRPVHKERAANQAGCYVTIVTDDGQRIETMLLSAPGRVPSDERRLPFAFEVGGQRYGLDLRRVHYDLPFAVRLREFQKRDHPGTMTPADFRSHVTVLEDGGEREAQIFMNHPLRKDGFVLYQTNWGPQHNGRPAGGPPFYSVFEVSENPSDQWPAYACYVIAFGLSLHFLAKLWRFLMSSTREKLIA